MADENKSITDLPIFQSALSYAKGLAKLSNQKILTSNLLLAGFLTVIEKDTEFKNNKSIRESLKNSDEIKRALNETGLNIPLDVEPSIDTKLPLSDDLKQILAKSKDDINSFVGALAGRLLSLKTLESSFCNQITAYASYLSIQCEDNIITPEIFSSAAFLAFCHGQLDVNQAVANYFIANKVAFEALIAELSLQLDAKPNDNQVIVPISEDIISAMTEAETESERLFACLDVGLKTGSEIISRIATAYHEAGHAIVSSILRPALSVTKVSIIKTEDYSGVTVYDPSNPFWTEGMTVEDLQSSLTTLLAGRACQLIKFGFNKIDDGAASDIERATDIAWRYIAKGGLDPEIGPINLEVISKLQEQASGWLFDEVQKRVQTVLKAAADRAEKLLQANWDQVEAVTSELLQKKDLTENDFSLRFVKLSLASLAGTKKAESYPVDRKIQFATVNGILQTPEGPVKYSINDALVIESGVPKWPISRKYFEKHYSPKNGLEMGNEGIYSKPPQVVQALQLTDSRRLDLSRGRGILIGKKGDWLVEYDDGEMSIVGYEQFNLLYKLI